MHRESGTIGHGARVVLMHLHTESAWRLTRHTESKLIGSSLHHLKLRGAATSGYSALYNTTRIQLLQ